MNTVRNKKTGGVILLCLTLLIITSIIVSCSEKTSSPVPAPSKAPTSTQFGTSAVKSVPISDAKIIVSLSKSSIKAGDTFTVDISVDTSTPYRGAQWKLSFNPQNMRCDNISEGNFFKDWAVDNGGSTLIFPQPSIDNVNGRVSDMGIAIMTQKSGGATGRGVLCTYYFTALTNEVATPTLADVLLSDENGKMSNSGDDKPNN